MVMMASCSEGLDGSGGIGGSSATTREELKSQFSTREGIYRLLASVELSRSSRPPPLPYGTMSTQPPSSGPNPPLRLSFVTITSNNESNTNNLLHDDNDSADIEMAEAVSPPCQSPGVIGQDLVLSDNDLDHCDVVDRTTTRFCFNLGKELFVYQFQGSRKIYDSTKALDKRVYKGTFPTCHDFNPGLATPDSLSLLIGFSGGQIQLVEPINKEVNKLYNEDRIIDKTRVTCLRWLPKSTTLFLVAHGSGHLYLYNIELNCGSTVPHYQNVKQGPGYVISNVKSKSPRNPISRWTLGEGAINEFAFSPCGLYIAVVSQDGFLRIFRYDKNELVGLTRSYFGGLICVCWSPDSKYVCVGGEDDLLTIWSFSERRVVARGQGHKSWVSVVAFDPYTTTYGDEETEPHQNQSHIGCCDPSGSQCTCVSVKPNVNNHSNDFSRPHLSSRHSRTSESAALRLSVSETTRLPACYRLGSVSQDTQLCLWDLTEDILKQPFGKSRPATTSGSGRGDTSPCPQPTKTSHMNGKSSPPRVNSFPATSCKSHDKDVVDSVSVKGHHRSNEKGQVSSAENGSHGILSLRFAGLTFGGGQSDKDKSSGGHRRNFSLGGGNKDKVNGPGKGQGSDVLSQLNLEDPLKLIGTQACPRLDECPLLEPLICKKISHERLTSLIFREESIVTACQDGVLCTWSRPGDELKMNCTRKKYPVTTANLAQDSSFNRFYNVNSKDEMMEPL